MGQMAWDNSLSVGIDLVDEQHKMLITRLSDLSEAVELNRGEAQIAKTLDFLVDYTDFHFSTEEKHMTEQDYPGLGHHKEQHDQFKTLLRHLVEDFEEEGATRALATSINVFLVNWLVNHIKGVDIEFGKFLNEKDLVISE